jgi:D-alanyl-D-alanine carboxypeptidase/D-alanyl-D-alanine-endopeptidase (penicillin-binding protein 4)
MKLFTTLTALEQLGPAFRGRTEFRSSAGVNGVLQGDLICAAAPMPISTRTS